MTTVWAERASSEEDAVVRWRFDALVRAGYSWGCALRLAKQRDVDLRLAEKLVHDGCPHEMALRILL